MKYFIKGNYYFDIDLQNQLRITGPENHLLLGLAVPPAFPITIENYDVIDEQLSIELSVPTDEIYVPLPLVTDIRTLRHEIEPVMPHPTYKDLIDQNVKSVMPRNRKQSLVGGSTVISLSNTYVDGSGIERSYGAELTFPPGYIVRMTDASLAVKSNTDKIHFFVYSITAIESQRDLDTPIFAEIEDPDPNLLSPGIISLFDESRIQVEHLVKNRKTSSFEYGTIFPRDWIESADLGTGDLSVETIDYMYRQSMKYVSESGEGWHEEVIGEYRSRFIEHDKLVDRKMIDIEPHYILGVPRVSKRFLFDDDNHEKFKRVAAFVLKKADEKEFITFKQIDPNKEDFYPVGNWRDSANAFPGQKSPLAPYDVNCVFYPQALKIIHKYHEYFEITDLGKLEKLIEKWDHHKIKFRLYHPNDISGYSLALHGKKNIPMPTAHLDESYDLFYNSSDLESIMSFAKKIIDPDFFYTPVGPILVASDEPEFTTKQYHGKVIWPKQVGFAVAGMAKQYRIGLAESWPDPIMEALAEAIIMTCEASFRGWKDLNSVPELYYYDSEQDRARLYTDQEDYEGQMSLIQLWSAVSCRLIVREYQFIKKELEHK